MFIRAYLRASTSEQDASRARDQLDAFAKEYGHAVATHYTENASGANADRPELRRMLSDAKSGDVILVEAIDRLSRMKEDDWKRLRAEIEAKGLRVVAVDLPTSHQGMKDTRGDEFTSRMLDAINGMMIDMLAAIARKDYEDRRRRQAQGIAKAKAEGVYKGRPKDEEKRSHIRSLLMIESERRLSVRRIAAIVGCSTSTVTILKRELEQAGVLPSNR